MNSTISAFIFYILIFFLFACKNQAAESKDLIVQDELQIRDINMLRHLSINFEINSLMLDENINDSLKRYDLDFIFSDSNTALMQKEAIDIILLRTYNYHLIRAHHGYNLNIMKTDGTKILIDRFVTLYNLDTSGPINEFFNSGYPFDIIKNDSSLLGTPKIDSLIKEINKSLNEF